MNTVPAGTPSDVLSTYSAANAFTYLVYKCQATAYNSSSAYIDFQFEINPIIDLSTHQLITSMMFSVAGGNMGSSYQNYRPHWYWTDSDDTLYDFSCRSQYTSQYSQGLAYFTVPVGDFVIDNEVSNTANCYFRPIPVKFSDEENVLELSSNFVDVFGSSGIPMDDGTSYYYMLLQCPILSDGYINNVPGSGGGSGDFDPEIIIANGYFDVDGNIELQIDLEQLLELLDTIAEKEGFTQEELEDTLDDELSEDGPLSWIGENIADAIGGIFLPDEDSFEDFSDDIEDEFDEHLGAIGQLGDIFDEQFQYLIDAISVDQIYLGQIDAPVEFDSEGQVLTTFSIGGWYVDLKPYEDELSVLYNALYYMIDITVVLMVLNMLKIKHDVILNPEGECITYDN